MSSATNKPTRIVMLGGGYVTVWAYRALARRLRGELRAGQVEIVVVTPETHHTFHGWTGEVLAGIVPMQHYLTALRPLLKRARFVRGEAILVNLEQQSVSVALSGLDRIEQLDFDHLVFGTGSYEQLDQVPGLAEHGWRLKEVGSVLALRNQVLDAVEQADSSSDPADQERLLSFVIAGGGFAGVEMCAALSELLEVSRRHYPILQRRRPRFVLVQSGSTLLPQLYPRYRRLTAYATRQLERYGVEIRLETRLAEVSAEGARLSDGSVIRSATVVSTIGQTLRALPGSEGLPRSADGRLITDAALHVRGHANLWAGGDVAQMIHPRTRQPCPSNALWAIKHGARLGDNLARALRGQPVRPFTYPGLGQAASLGVGRGATELYTMQFTGWVGWLLRLGFFLFFMPARAQAVRVTLDWLTYGLLGRHIVPLHHPADARTARGQARAAEALPEAALEPAERAG